jgi:glycosyltransferase involved in cell wall biosynthesis
MKVLHLNTFDSRGGAARAAYRIHRALRTIGVRSSMLVACKDGADHDVKVHPVGWQDRKVKWANRILSWQKTTNPTWHSCNLFPSGLHRAVNYSDADIINLHWLGNEFVSIGEIAKIRKPIVWTLHDMWAFCGAEHYENINSAGRFRQGYTKHTRPKGYSGLIDCDAWVWRMKKKNWKKKNFEFIAPSRWLADSLSDSLLFRCREADVIPYPIETTIFRAHDKKKSRKNFGLQRDKKIILFGADWGTENPLKGYSYLEKALSHLSVRPIAESCQIAIFGGGNDKNGSKLNGIPVKNLGRITDDELLAVLYSTADVFVLPSILDNLPQTMLEALSCGVPGVGFKIGGVPDMIDHMENGYMAEPFKVEDLANGIEWVLVNAEKKQLGTMARLKVERENTYAVIGEQYERLYKRVLES